MQSDYADKWTQLRSMRKRMRNSGLSLFGITVLGKLISDSAPNAKAYLLPVVIAMGIVAAFLFGKAYVENLRWPCPKCGQPYHSKQQQMNASAKRCLHCNLPLWADANADASPTSWSHA